MGKGSWCHVTRLQQASTQRASNEALAGMQGMTSVICQTVWNSRQSAAGECLHPEHKFFAFRGTDLWGLRA